MRTVGLCLLLAVAACRSEPTFDERFEEAETEIRDKAQELDDQMDPWAEDGLSGDAKKPQ